jgi:sugar O-acyltransferase (sialic acid O-acetyltransferase NeuD family)
VIQRWQTVTPARKHIVMWGAADQARVNAPILRALGCEIAALVDDTEAMTSPLVGIPLFQGSDGLDTWLETQNIAQLGFVIAIGNPYGHVRIKLHGQLVARGLTPGSFSDPSALVCKSVRYDAGLQVMPAAIVHNDVVVGKQCILNTRALVEHDCVLEDGVEVGPGATLCGRVKVGRNTWIGAGATVRPRVTIGRNVIIGVGAAVVTDIPDNAIAVGVPARSVARETTPSALARGE